MPASLVDFEIIRPDYEFPQEFILEWTAKVHAQGEAHKNGWSVTGPEYASLHQEVKERLFKVGFGKDKIQKKGVSIRDCSHENWEEMEIYKVGPLSPEGVNLKERTRFYEKCVGNIFERFYPEGKKIPPHLIHVTCTGYVSPSGAQMIASKRGFGATTTVTHAYHMGCYASIPALRMAKGFLHTSEKQKKAPVDIVHTEVCSIHMNPLLHETSQLVVQSLFGDGFIKYSITEEERPKSLRLLALHEELIMDSSELMTWKCADWGIQMTIAKEVPVVISYSLEGFLKTLSEKAERDLEKIKKGWFAIHPGGPKIISQVGKILQLEDAQLSHSQAVLQEHGNMSSATLPHVWERMLKDPSIASGSLIVSLAFGPGLTVCGAVFEKG